MYKKYMIQKILLLLIAINIVLMAAEISHADETADGSPNITINTYPELSVKKTRSTVSDMYSSIIYANESNIRTIKLNGLSTDIVPIPADSYILQLPENHYVYRSPEKTTNLLPKDTQLTYYETTPILIIPGEAIALEVTNLKQFSIDELVSTATFRQSISQLNHYSFQLTLNAFNQPILSEFTTNYTVSWGDDTTTTYESPAITHNHIYEKAGKYNLTITLTDAFGYTYLITYPYTVEYEGHLLHTYLIVEDNKEPVAVTTTTSLGTLALVFIALTETGKYKFLALLPLLFPMYTRISKEDVLDQFVRGQIFGYIKTNPGVHYNQIRRDIDVKNGTLSYHLRVLEKTELVKSRREGIRYRAFYPTGMKFPHNERFRLTELQITILDHIKQHPGINQREIARKLRKKPQTINYNIKVLEQATLIDVHHSGRKTGLYAIGTDADIQLIGQ